MRALKVTAFAALAAVALAAVPAPASAGPHWHGGHGWGHGGWGHHYGWGGPGLVFGLAAGALAIGATAECVHYEPVTDDFGNVVGRRRVWEC